jgi:hypothetical protein
MRQPLLTPSHGTPDRGDRRPCWAQEPRALAAYVGASVRVVLRRRVQLGGGLCAALISALLWISALLATLDAALHGGGRAQGYVLPAP